MLFLIPGCCFSAICNQTHPLEDDEVPRDDPRSLKMRHIRRFLPSLISLSSVSDSSLNYCLKSGVHFCPPGLRYASGGLSCKQVSNQSGPVQINVNRFLKIVYNNAIFKFEIRDICEAIP